MTSPSPRGAVVVDDRDPEMPGDREPTEQARPDQSRAEHVHPEPHAGQPHAEQLHAEQPHPGRERGAATPLTAPLAALRRALAPAGHPDSAVPAVGGTGTDGPRPDGTHGPDEKQRDEDEPDEVQVVDTPATRVRHPADLVGLVLTGLGLAVVLVLAVYAQGTTTGVTEDVQGFASLLRRILFVPVAVLEGLITLIAPIAVLTELAVRRLVRHAFEAVAAAVVGVLLALLAAWSISRFGTPDLISSFTVRVGGERVLTIPALLTGTAALLTAAGARNRRRTVAWSWNLLWIGLGVSLITGLVTLPGALTTVLLGRLVGLGARYLSGVQSERAYGPALVDGVRRAGFHPVRLVRVRDVAVAHPDGEEAMATDLAAVAITRYGDNRVYAMTTAEGDRLDVVVLDGDRQVVGMLTRFWRSLRLRGLDGRAVVSLRQAAERASLLSYAAWSAGVCTPRLLGMAEAEDSMLLIQQHAHGAVPLRDLPDEELTDDVLDAIWEQLRVAHSAGLAHRALTSDVVMIETAHAADGVGCEPGSAGQPRPVDAARHARGHDAQHDAQQGAQQGAEPDTGPDIAPGTAHDRPVALLTGWDSGDVASSQLARRLDISQLLAVLAVRVGAERAVASAGRVLREDLGTIGPLLQTIALPSATREEVRRHKSVLTDLREALLALLPEADVEPESLVRFGARTVISVVLTVVAAVVVITTINFNQITAALTSAEPWWAVVAFALGMVTFLGSALTLVAFAPIRLPLWRTTLVQCAAAFVSLVAPAGVGPAALNLRMLTRRGVGNPLAVASVGLVQVSQFITTVLLLLVLSLVSGSRGALELPSSTVLATIVIIVVLSGIAMLVPQVRQWVAVRTLPVWRQTWPRLVQLLGQPKRFAVAVVGNLLMTLGYLGAFYACLAAFGRNELTLIDLALIYLVGNAAGAAVPTPGGLGAVEAALILGLTTTAGIPGAIATSVVVLFRGLTFWGRIPFGWVAMRRLQRTNEL